MCGLGAVALRARHGFIKPRFMSAKLLKNEGEPRFELLRVLRHPAVGASSGGSGNNPAHVFSKSPEGRRESLVGGGFRIEPQKRRTCRRDAA